jgi:glycerol dehydrogenase
VYRHFESPQRYVQGRGILAQAGGYLGDLGQSFAVIADATVEALVRAPLTQGLAECGLEVRFVRFDGECHCGEVRRLVAACQGVDAVVGAGGGRAVDTAKLVGKELSLPVITCPTSASTDAPVSRVAVLNRPDGSVEEVVLLPRSPALVLVDSDIVARAPVRFLVAGMGDAMATWFEARACQRAGGVTLFGGAPTWAGLALARRCWENLRKWALPALAEAREGISGPALETVIETNILLSGLGFENGGLALAHALHNGLTQLPATHRALHGEKVAFGLLVQCLVEGAEETEEVLSLLVDLGLPVTLEELGCEADEEVLRPVVDHVFSRERRKVENEPVEVTPERLLAAILQADALGRAARGRR